MFVSATFPLEQGSQTQFTWRPLEAVSGCGRAAIGSRQKIVRKYSQIFILTQSATLIMAYKRHGHELAEMPFRGALFLQATEVLYFPFRWGPQNSGLWASNGLRAASLRPLPQSIAILCSAPSCKSIYTIS